MKFCYLVLELSTHRQQRLLFLEGGTRELHAPRRLAMPIQIEEGQAHLGLAQPIGHLTQPGDGERLRLPELEPRRPSVGEPRVEQTARALLLEYLDALLLVTLRLFACLVLDVLLERRQPRLGGRIHVARG